MVREQVIDALVRARGLVERGWCQGWFALDADGLMAATMSPQACRFCALGATHRAAGTSAGVAADCCAALRQALGMPGVGIDQWNDAPERTQSDVLALYDRAIALARAEVAP